MAVAVRALCPVLIGREAELSALEDALLAARRGRGGVVILGGEAGMGKTRLAAELVRRAERLGCVVMSGSCTEAEVALPYLPFLEAIGNHLGREDVGALIAELGPAAAELGQLFPQLGAGAAVGGDPVHSKLRLFEAILLLLTRAAGEDGLLLVLEDLHWADPATRELLDYLTRRLRSTNVLTLATYRTEELHRKHALLPTIQGWKRSGSVELVEVDPLGEDGICAMLCAIFDQETISDEFVSFLRERTEGNPFVIEEMLKEAVDRGDIFRTDEGWDRKDVRELRVPPTVRDGILLRLERLPAEDAQVLSAASVVGRSFDVPVIAAAAQLSPDDVLDSLQRCVMHQLVEEDESAPGTYRFRHALTREAIYEDMVTPRRQQLHSRVADVLAAQERPSAELAHHLLLARRDAEAVELCRKAAAEAYERLAYMDAASLLERAAPLVADSAERGRVLCAAADARWNNTEPGVARRLLEEGIGLLEGAGAAAEVAHGRLLLGRCHWELGRTDLAQHEFETARAVLEPLGPSEDLSVAYARLAGIPMFSFDYATAFELAQRAEQTAQAAGAERALSWAWVFMSGPLILLGEVERGLQLARRAYDLAVARGFWFQAGNASFNTFWSCLHLGLGREAREWDARRAALPEGAVELWSGYLSGLRLLYEGDPVAALEAIRPTREHAEEMGYSKQAWRSRVAEAHALAELGRADEAAAALPPLSSRVDRQDAIYDGAARVRTALAGDGLEAAKAAARTIDTAASGVTSPLDAAAGVLVDDPETLHALVDGLNPSREAAGLPRHLAIQGLVRLADGELERAVEILTLAEARFREEGYLLDAWYTALGLARARLAQNDRAAARALLVRLLEEAEPRGARLVARLARELGAGLELPAAPEEPPSGDSGEPEPTGERLVTVLFADIRGYTETVAASAPADLADRVAAFHRWAASAVAAHHGVVDKFAGDAVMATFNIAGASVDHAEQAVLCALEIVEKAAAGDLPVGAGVATGAAVVGRLTEQANLSVLGLATNLAARLQSASGAGEVTVSEETHRRLSERLRERAARVDLELKGFPERVPAYRLSGARPRPRGAAAKASGAA